MDVQSLLPPNGTRFIRAFEQTTAYERRVSAGIDLIPDVKGRELPDWLKFLLYEYGLIELTAYVPSPYVLLSEGRLWQIERDTWAAVTRGLGWVGNPGSIEEAPARREWWNSFQLRFSALPSPDVPTLDRIERVTALSKPFRSDFRRGVYWYDVPALEGDATRLDASLLDRESGVTVRAGGPLWSFGRPWEVEHVLTKAEGLALGNWIDRIAEASFLVNFLTGEAIVSDAPATIEDATNFSRASGKWAVDLAGAWAFFDVDEPAITDRGICIEPAATRKSQFWLDVNPLEDTAAAQLLASGLADPFGGATAARFRFSDTGNVLYVPCSGLLPNTTYGVSAMAKLVSSSGSGIGGILPSLVAGEWVRIETTITTPADLDGQWLDLTLYAPGAVVDVDLCGFQVEAGRVTSPIVGDTITGTRAADVLTLDLPGEDAYGLTITFDNGTAQPLLGAVGETLVDPTTLERFYIAEIGSLRTGTWESMTFPWSDAVFPWNGDAVRLRARTLAEWFDGREVHFRLKNAAGGVIGFRRARVARQVSPLFTGHFRFGNANYAADPDGTSVLIEAMTDAGNGLGSSVASVDLVFGGVPAGVPAGRLWKTPSQLTGGTAIAPSPISIPLRATVRELVKLMLRF